MATKISLLQPIDPEPELGVERRCSKKLYEEDEE
jgi:hypothetical protein